MCKLLDKLEEMAGVMQQAVRMDDENEGKVKEHIARLEVENQTLRQLLEICTTAKHPILSLDSALNNTPSDTMNTSDSQNINNKK